MRSFVHEVLRRSRTSGVVLQTALCYLEAIRSKVPDLVKEEKAGFRKEMDSGSRILKADESDHTMDANCEMHETFPNAGTYCPTWKTMADENAMDPLGSQATLSQSQVEKVPATTRKTRTPSPPLPPLPSMPSPLLCPRRAFLASLILASKFTQDRCYSNRAWAKLSGLSPREIGRCERALGDALNWRLWVGKKVSPSSTLSINSRAVIRSRSEGNLTSGNESTDPKDSHISSQPPNRGLKRSSTLPADLFSSVPEDSLNSAPCAHIPLVPPPTSTLDWTTSISSLKLDSSAAPPLQPPSYSDRSWCESNPTHSWPQLFSLVD